MKIMKIKQYERNIREIQTLVQRLESYKKCFDEVYEKQIIELKHLLGMNIDEVEYTKDSIDAINDFLIKNKITYKQVGEEVGLSSKTVSAVLCGKSCWKRATDTLIEWYEGKVIANN